MDSASFLVEYGFELKNQAPEMWCQHWSQHFPEDWIPSALIEAFYQGRYKATSVEQLLLQWIRRGHPRLSYTSELTCRIWPDYSMPAVGTLQSLTDPLSPEPIHREAIISSQQLIQLLSYEDIPTKLKQLSLLDPSAPAALPLS